SNTKLKGSKVKKTLYERIDSFADALEIDEFFISDFSTAITDTSASKIASLDSFSLQFSDIRIDSASAQKLLPSAIFKGSAKSLQWEIPSGMYQFKLKRFRFSSTDSLFLVKNFVVNPRYPKYTFSK